MEEPHRRALQRFRPAASFSIALIIFLLICISELLTTRSPGQQHLTTFTLFTQQALHEEGRESCWRCVRPGWRQHFIFANSSAGHLDACPDSNSWPTGAWYRTSVKNVGSHDGTQQKGRKARPGEAAVLPGTLLAQQALWSNQHPADCSAAKFVMYRAAKR
jgi:hypothetical protein